MLEKDVVKRFRDECIKQGCQWIHKNHGGPMSGGRVDQELCFKGVLILAEAKRSRAELLKDGPGGVTPLQWNDIERCRKAGGVAFAYTVEPAAARGTYYVVVRWRRDNNDPMRMLLENFIASLKEDQHKLQNLHTIFMGALHVKAH